MRLAGGATRAAPLGEPSALTELGADGALEVVLREWDLLLGGEERRARAALRM